MVKNVSAVNVNNIHIKSREIVTLFCMGKVPHHKEIGLDVTGNFNMNYEVVGFGQG